MMFTGVPNMTWVFGYFRASWTLRAELVAEFVGRLLKHMKATGAVSMAPELRPSEAGMERRPWIADDNFNPNYLKRSMHLMPRSGPTREWQPTQDRSEEHTSELQSLMRISYAGSCLKNKNKLEQNIKHK